MSAEESDIAADIKNINAASDHLACSFVGTVFGQVPRVLLGRSYMYANPWACVMGSYPYFLNGLGINMIRGTSATGFQSWTKSTVQEQYGLTPSLVAASFGGAMIATGLETYFIRKTNLDDLLRASLPAMRFSPALTSLYFAREVGFTTAVLAKKDLSPTGQKAAILCGAYFTGSMHRLAAFEATRDSLKQGITGPDLREGLVTTVRKMTFGGYTHAGFQVPVPNPVTRSAMIRNFLSVSCGANTFVFRLLYLAVFNEGYSFAEERLPSIKSGYGFFARAAKQEQTMPEPDQRQRSTSVP